MMKFWLHPDTGEIYSAKAGALVPATDPDYVAYLATGALAVVWPRDENNARTHDALAAVLDHYGWPTSGLPGLTQPST